jgi:hypothetical protein
MIYNICITTIFIVLLIVVLKNFIKIIYFTKNNNFDKNYKATRIDANKYSIDKWVKVNNNKRKKMKNLYKNIKYITVKKNEQ